jgi:photosystem II stability/assembly factor-like uncharacterized protein
VSRVAVSPDFANDGLLLGFASLIDHRVILRSEDGGRTLQHLGGPLAFHGVSAFAFSPAFAQDGVVFASSPEDGVWVSTDRGRSFTKAGGELAGLFVTDLAVSPGFASDGVVLASTHVGLFRSADGGASWTPVSTGLAELDLSAVAFGPGPGGPVAFSAGLTIHRSDDLGLSWQAQSALPSVATSLAVSSGFDLDESALVATRLHGVRVTTDGGVQWRPSNAGLTDPLTSEVTLWSDGRALLATLGGVFTAPAVDGAWTQVTEGFESLDPDAAKHYLGVSAADGPGAPAFVAALEGLFRSDDGGGTWTQLDVFHGLVDLRLAVSPSYASDRSLFVGTYGGGVKRWREPLHTPPARGGPASSVVGQAGPAPSALPGSTPAAPGAATGGSPKGTDGWSTHGDGIQGPWCDGLAVADDGTLFFCYLGLFRSTNGGASWDKLPLPPAASVVREVAVSPDFAADGTVFAGTNGVGVFRSTDGGDTWNELMGGLPAGVKTRRIRFSPDHAVDGTVFLATWSSGLLRSTDGGDTWSAVGAGLTTDTLRGLALSPHFAADGVVLVGTGGAGLFRSTDGGLTFVDAGAGLPPGEAREVETVAFAPDGSLALLGAMDGGLFLSRDGGASWVDSGAPLVVPARDLAFSPVWSSDGTAWVGTHDGVWRTRDGARSWERLPGFARIDDRDNLMLHEGSWAPEAASPAHALTVTASGQAGDAVSYAFHGSRIAWHGPRGPDMAVARLLVDGVPLATVDLWAPVAEPSAPRFAHVFGAAGWHTIRVEHTGLTHPSATGAQVRTDGFSWHR